MRRDGMFTRSMTLVKATDHFADPNGIKTSIASAITAQTYRTFNGTNVCGGGFGALASYPTVTTGSHAGAHVAGSKVYFTGTYNRATVTRTATLVAEDGGETLVADGPLDIGSVTLIVVEAQADTDGTFEFGWQDILPKGEDTPFKLVARAAGAVTFDTEAGETDTVTLAVHGEVEAWVKRLRTATAAATLTLYQ